MSRPARIAVGGILVFTVGMSAASFLADPLWSITIWSIAALGIWGLIVVLIVESFDRSRKRKQRERAAAASPSDRPG